MTEIEALRSVFPNADRVVYDPVELTVEQAAAVQKLLGGSVRRRLFRAFIAVDKSGDLDGYAFIQQEIGKFKYFDFIVAVTPDVKARRITLIAYRESRGGEIARRRHLRQLEGKSLDDPIRTSQDILNIVGATMSVDSLNRGVKKILAVVETVYRRDPERLTRALAQGQVVEEFGARPVSNGEGEFALHRESELKFGGSLCEIEIWDRDKARARRACRAAFDEVDRLQALLSDYDPSSELSRISRSGADGPVPISETTAEFLMHAQAISHASDGAFDVTVGSLVDAWGFRLKEPRRPSNEELRRLRSLVDFRAVSVQRRKDGSYEAVLALDGVRLDPGGLGKGFAVDRMIAALRREGVERALVNFSGNMYALGAPPGRDGWKVAVRDPSEPDRISGTLTLRDEAISSSGGYEKFVVIDGEQHSHILSPRTMQPLPGRAGAVVRAPNATLADGWSTAAVVLEDEAIERIERHKDLSALVAHAGAVWESDDWTVDPIDID